jgi:hypothetical protein
MIHGRRISAIRRVDPRPRSTTLDGNASDTNYTFPLREVVLFFAFLPNPRWKFGSHHMQDCAAATQRAREAGAPTRTCSTTGRRWWRERSRSICSATTSINPNDFGHWIYYRVLRELGL